MGEDVVGADVRDFVECFGPPVRQRKTSRERCLFYRERSGRTYWEFCVRDGRIVGGLGNLPRPR